MPGKGRSDTQNHVRRHSPFPLLFTISAPLLFVSWMVFVGTFDKWELLIGMGVALVGATAICIVQRAEGSHFLPRFHDLMQVIFIPWLLIQGTFEILFVSLRDLFGDCKAVSAFLVVTFKAGEPGDAHDAARSVLAVALTTMAPNFIVFGMNIREKQLLFHQIKKSGVPKMTKNLGAIA